MYQENVVLCGASAYEQKYYFNKDFDSLPDHVKKELQIMCVLFTEEIGGIFTLEFDDHGNLQFKTEATEADGFYDDIGGALKIKKLRVDHANQEVKGGIRVRHNQKKCSLSISQHIQFQFIVHGTVAQFLNIKGREPCAAGNQDGFCRFTCRKFVELVLPPCKRIGLPFCQILKE